MCNHFNTVPDRQIDGETDKTELPCKYRTSGIDVIKYQTSAYIAIVTCSLYTTTITLHKNK